MLISTRIIAPPIGSVAILDISVTFLIIMFIGIFRITVTRIPIIPEQDPTINVSALKTREISFLLAPIALKIPIYFVLFRTLI